MWHWRWIWFNIKTHLDPFELQEWMTLQKDMPRCSPASMRVWSQEACLVRSLRNELGLSQNGGCPQREKPQGFGPCLKHAHMVPCKRLTRCSMPHWPSLTHRTILWGSIVQLMDDQISGSTGCNRTDWPLAHEAIFSWEIMSFINIQVSMHIASCLKRQVSLTLMLPGGKMIGLWLVPDALCKATASGRK